MVLIEAVHEPILSLRAHELKRVLKPKVKPRGQGLLVKFHVSLEGRDPRDIQGS